MTRPQKCKRGLRPTNVIMVSEGYLNDPTAEMQKGIKTIYKTVLNEATQKYDPTAEMQKGIKTIFIISMR